MKKSTLQILAIALVIGLIVVQQTITAQTTEEKKGTKLGYVDLERVLSDSMQGRENNKKIKEYINRKQGEIDEAKKDLMQMEEELIQQKFILTEEALETKKEEFRRKLIEIDRMREDAEYYAEKYAAKLTKDMKTDVYQIISKIGEDEGYTMIVNKTPGLLIYVDDQIDLSDKVVKMYDKQTLSN